MLFSHSFSVRSAFKRGGVCVRKQKHNCIWCYDFRCRWLVPLCFTLMLSRQPDLFGALLFSADHCTRKNTKNILNRQSACQHVTNNPNFTPFHPWRKESHYPAQSSYPVPTLSGHPTPSHRHSNRISTFDWDGVRGARLPLPYLPRLTRRRTETTSQGAWSSFRVLWSLHLASTSE